MGGGLVRGARAACAVVALSLLLLSSCASKPEVLDLAHNERLYQPPRYHARLPADRPALLLPVDDQRHKQPADASAPHWPRRPMPEELWARPIPEMVDDLLRRSLADSGVVAQLDTRVPPAAEVIVVQPVLLDARGYLEEQAAGRCTLSSFTLKLVVSSPAAADGTRATIFEQTYEQSAGSQVTRSPTPIPELLGRCVRDAIARVLADLDRNNVGRSGLPSTAK
ncbi:MAG: hypothetical protein U1F36_06200 [Planctomycetota bacterium]